MIASLDDFSAKLIAYYSQAKSNLQKKANGRTDIIKTTKQFSFDTVNQVKTRFGVGQFNNPTTIPWVGFIAPTQTIQNGIYPALLFYVEQQKVIVAYGISATNVPSLQWGEILDKKEQNPLTIGDYFLSIGVSDNRHDYDKSYVYSAYKDDLNDPSIVQNIYKDLDVLFSVYQSKLSFLVSAPPKPPIVANPISTKTSSKTVITAKDFDINTIISQIRSTGLLYPDIIIKRLAYSLMAKPFVILSGLSGSGKTQLALQFAYCLSETKEQVCTVSIGADWTNREPLLGYPNALDKNDYVVPESGALQLLIEATKNEDKPYFLILDEMNLSVVERYFADFLSAIESGEAIKLWTIGNKSVPTEIKLPKNVFIIGTINVDETTYMFSPKVLDRANVIEFKIMEDDMNQYLNNSQTIDSKKAYFSCQNMAKDFVKKAKEQYGVIYNKKETEIFLSFFRELKKVNAEFGYRSINEIGRYLISATKDKKGLNEDQAIDTAILQKLLPKLHGSRKKLEPILSAMWKLCLKDNKNNDIESSISENDFNYPESAEKIQRMYKAVVDNGFTSFAEA